MSKEIFDPERQSTASQNQSVIDTFVGSGFSQSGNVNELFGYGSPNIAPDNPQQLAIIDIETSGLEPTRGRVIEIAIVTLDLEGQTLEEYSTLINPQDGIAGASFIHHIVPRMLEDAPTFADVAPDILSRLSGKVVVAHNALFEESFLRNELKRCGIIPKKSRLQDIFVRNTSNTFPRFRAMDSLQFLPRHVSLPNYKQATLVRHFGIQTDEHTALGDSRGLARIISNFLPQVFQLGYPLENGETKAFVTYDQLRQRVTNLRKGEIGWMANLLAKLPYSSFASGDHHKFAYWDLLSEVLADGKITGEEIKQIAIYVGRHALSESDVRQLNEEFFRQLVVVAEADGIVTSEEKAYLEKIARELAISQA